MLAILEREPLNYRTVRRSGSHRRLESERHPPLTFAFHDRATIAGGLVRKILIKDVALPRTRRASYSKAMDYVRVIYHHEDGAWWAESPDVDGWSAAGDTFVEVRTLAVEGIPFALGHEAAVEHFVPADERIAA